jgi:hypothetical protein
MKRQGGLLIGVLLVVGLMMLAGCAAKTSIPPAAADAGGLFATARGKVTRINRGASWFELKPKSGGALLTINYDATTTLLNFKGMIEITKEQPVEVTYMPGSEPVNRAISIRKLLPDECS